MIMQSSNRAYDSSENKYTNPVWELDLDANTIIHTDEDTLEEERYDIYRDCERYHLNYLSEHGGMEKLQRLLDTGEILDYLEDLTDKVYEACDSQVERWKESDPDYQAAVLNNDYYEQAAILNRMDMQAKEIVYPELVYTI